MYGAVPLKMVTINQGKTIILGLLLVHFHIQVYLKILISDRDLFSECFTVIIFSCLYYG